MSKVERIIVWLTLVSIVVGGLVTAWKIASAVDRRLSLLEKCSADAKEADQKIVTDIGDDIDSVIEITSDLEDDVDKLDRKIDRFDQELRQAHIDAAAASGERFRFDENRIIHLWTEIDSIRSEMAGVSRRIQGVARIAIRLDSVVYDIRLEQARRDSIEQAELEKPEPKKQSLIKRIVPLWD